MRDKRVSSVGNGDSSSQHHTKWTRLLLRELYDLGFCNAAAALEREACVQVRSSSMEQLQGLVAAYKWDEALQFVTQPKPKLRMKSPRAAREAALLLLQRKFIDLLLNQELALALRTFQQEIMPKFELSELEVSQLAELLLCRNVDEMKQRAQMPWQDEELQLKMEELVSPDEVIPEGALKRLVEYAPELELQLPPPMRSEKVTGCCLDVLSIHKRDVWELAFSPDGEMLASASSDGTIALWEIKWEEEMLGCMKTLQRTTLPVHILQSVDEPADCLSWSPDSRLLLSSGCRSSSIQLWDRMSEECEKRFQHPGGTVTKLQWMPDGNQFVSGSADKSLVLWDAEEGSIVYNWSGRRILDVVVHPQANKVFVLVSGYEIRAYDIHHKSVELFFEAEHLISCITLSPSGRFLLVNFVKQQELVCFDIATGSLMAKYRGLCEQRYVLRPCFCGAHSEFVVSGCEDGMIHLWERDSGKMTGELDGHSSVVNVVVRHPFYSHVIASASDDKTIRLWSIKEK